MPRSFKRLFGLSLLSGLLLTSMASLVSASEANEQRFTIKVEWGVFNIDGTPALGPVDLSQKTDFTGDLSFSDSIGVLARTLSFERGEDQVTGTSSTVTSFRSSIAGGIDGMIFNFTGNFADGMTPSLYYHTQHEGRNVTLPLADLMADPDQKLEYVIDTDSRFKIFFSIIPTL